jgi:nitroreductase
MVAPLEPSAVGASALSGPYRGMLLAARTAPSAHNSQPWVFKTRPDGLELGWASARELPQGDPRGTYLMTGLGAAAEASALGAALDDGGVLVTWDPDASARRVAVLGATDGSSSRDRELAAGLDGRATSRLPFRREAPETAVLRSIAGEAESHGASLALVTGPSRLRRFADLTAEGTARNMADPGVYGEFLGWLRLGPRERTAVDGLTGSALGLGPARSRLARSILSTPAMNAWRRIGAHRVFARTQRRLAESCGAAGLLTVPSNRAEDVFAGGRVLLRVWLAATVAGLRVHPMTAAMDHAETREALAHLFGVPGDAPCVASFRVGYGPPGVRAPRRPLSDLIDPTLPP